MTRINCIPPAELTTKHLVAEYRELPRVFALAKVCDVPPLYTLGTGHMKFFYNKLNYLYRRQHMLVYEMLRRGYAPKFDPAQLLADFGHLEAHGLWNDWKPTVAAMRLSRARINERLAEKRRT